MKNEQGIRLAISLAQKAGTAVTFKPFEAEALLKEIDDLRLKIEVLKKLPERVGYKFYDKDDTFTTARKKFIDRYGVEPTTAIPMNGYLFLGPIPKEAGDVIEEGK